MTTTEIGRPVNPHSFRRWDVGKACSITAEGRRSGGNEGHWTADAIWDEDARRPPWTRDRTGIVNVGILRVLAINILALLRSMCYIRKGDRKVALGWSQVVEYAVQVLLEPGLETGAFDEFD